MSERRPLPLHNRLTEIHPDQRVTLVVSSNDKKPKIRTGVLIQRINFTPEQPFSLEVQEDGYTGIINFAGLSQGIESIFEELPDKDGVPEIYFHNSNIRFPYNKDPWSLMIPTENCPLEEGKTDLKTWQVQMGLAKNVQEIEALIDDLDRQS